MTEGSVFDESNSTAAFQSNELKAYVQREKRRTGAGPVRASDLHLTDERVRAIPANGLTIIATPGENDRFSYYAVGLLSDGTPLKCIPNTKNTDRLIKAQRRFGIQTEEINADLGIPLIQIDGPKEAVAAYIVDEFKNGNLLCEISGRPEPGG